MTQKRRTAADAAALLASLGIDRSDGEGHDDAGAGRACATIYFDGDSVEVASDYLELVRGCAQKFNTMRAGMLIVSGHASGVDEPEHEVLLSHRRTRAVALLLEELGVLSHQIVCVSRGANEPLVDPSDSARRWINRRVEIREGALVPRPPAWAQQRRKKKAAAGKAAAAGPSAPAGGSAATAASSTTNASAPASRSAAPAKPASTRSRPRKS